MNKSSLGHSVTMEVLVPAELAFKYLAIPENIGRWALGCWDASLSEHDGLYSGTSLFDGEKSFFRVDADQQRLLIDYYLGEPGQLKPRISARVVEGPSVSASDSCCLVTLTAWRDYNMNDERWARLCASHEAEIFLVKSLIERS